MLPLLDSELACAVALGVVEHPRLIANVYQITLLDHRGQALACLQDWLQESDRLHQLTKVNLKARAEAQQANVHYDCKSCWSASSATMTSDTATQLVIQTRTLSKQLLAKRGVFTKAQSLGLRLFV